MTTLARPGALPERLAGQVVTESDAGYDDARRVWNADIDRRPALVVRCRTADDVSAAVGYARGHKLEIAVRCGAHSFPGASTVDDGMMIDLSPMRSVEIDPDARRARVGGGALLGDVDAAAQAHGLAFPLGMVSHTGVGGLVLGGGMGWLTRRHGLAVDNLVAAEVVLSDGRIVRAADDENPELFWALRGGGGNFGVVTLFEFALHPVGPVVPFGMFFFGLDQGVEALRLARDLVADLPAEVNLVVAASNAPPAPFVPEEYHFQPGYLLLLAGFGSEDEHAALVERIRAAVPPRFDMVTGMPYTALQQLIDDATAWGLHAYEKAHYLPLFTDEVISVIAEQVPRKTSGLSQVVLNLLDGAYSAVDEDATAFSGGRSPRLAAFIIAATATAEELPAERAWVRGFYEALAPYAIGRGVYVNSLAYDEPERVVDAYGPKFERLARIKAAVDPDNIFHRNANIAPRP